MNSREEIKIPDVPYKGMIDPAEEVGYIKLNSFTQTAGQEVRNAMKELKEQGAEKMILDLRGNGGGLLREAVNIVNLFVPKNELVVETKGKIPEWDKTYKTLSEPLDATIPLVVLVDGNSASASEIVAVPCRIWTVRSIIGERTYRQGPGATNARPLLQQQAEGDRGEVLHPQRPLHPEAGLRAPR
jgi:carboxyl-terminal processing protease